jgi:hypothetical protein
MFFNGSICDMKNSFEDCLFLSQDLFKVAFFFPLLLNSLSAIGEYEE